jgi:hypothetical protein
MREPGPLLMMVEMARIASASMARIGADNGHDTAACRSHYTLPDVP